MLERWNCAEPTATHVGGRGRREDNRRDHDPLQEQGRALCLGNPAETNSDLEITGFQPISSSLGLERPQTAFLPSVKMYDLKLAGLVMNHLQGWIVLVLGIRVDTANSAGPFHAPLEWDDGLFCINNMPTGIGVPRKLSDHLKRHCALPRCCTVHVDVSASVPCFVDVTTPVGFVDLLARKCGVSVQWSVSHLFIIATLALNRPCTFFHIHHVIHELCKLECWASGGQH